MNRTVILAAALGLAGAALAQEKPTCDSQLATAQKQIQILSSYLTGKSGELDLTSDALRAAQAKIVDLQKQLEAAKPPAAPPEKPTTPAPEPKK